MSAPNSFNFTKRAIEAIPLPPAGKRTRCFDAKTRGLAVEVTSAGTVTFKFYRKFKGEPIRLSLGTYPEMKIEEARGEAGAMNSALSKKINPADERRLERKQLTLGAFFKEYLERHAKPHKKTWKEDVAIFDRYLDKWKNKKLSSITRRHIEERRKDIKAKGGYVKHADEERTERNRKLARGSMYGANRMLALLRAIFNRAIEWGYFDGPNPTKGIKNFREKSRERFLQPDELPRFFQALADEPNTAMRDFFLVCLLTGARRGNVMTMRWEDISSANQIWTIPDTKSGDSHTVPLVKPAIEILEARQTTTESEWVFPGRKKKGNNHIVEVKSAWARILKRAQIKDLRIHDLRRTLGSWQAIQGSSLAIIGKSLAHKNVSTTMIYARLNTDPVRESLERATAAMLNAGTPAEEADVIDINRHASKG